MLQFLQYPVNFLRKLMYKFKFLQNFDRLDNEGANLPKRHLQQPIDQECNILNTEYFDMMVPMLGFTRIAQHRVRLWAVSIHADEIISWELVQAFLSSLVFFADYGALAVHF